MTAVRVAAVAGLRRVRDDWLRIVEATFAAAVAWLIAVKVLGHPQPFFAPASALIALGSPRASGSNARRRSSSGSRSGYCWPTSSPTRSARARSVRWPS